MTEKNEKFVAVVSKDMKPEDMKFIPPEQKEKIFAERQAQRERKSNQNMKNRQLVRDADRFLLSTDGLFYHEIEEFQSIRNGQKVPAIKISFKLAE